MSLRSWLGRDPEDPVGDDEEQWAIDLWWERNFYPSIQELANDLYAKGLVDEGEYRIRIEW